MQKIVSFLGMNLPAVETPVAERGDGNNLRRSDHAAGYSYQYDDQGRLTEVRYPDGARQSFSYDHRGNVARRQTAEGHVLTYAYDLQSRLISVASDSERLATYAYGPGHFRCDNAACRSEFEFNANNQLTQARQTIDGFCFLAEYAYDAAGRCIGMRPPGSKQWLCYDYDEQTRTLCVCAEDGTLYATAHGEVLEYSNGLTQKRRVDRQGRVEQIEVIGPDRQPVLDLNYKFNDRWQIERINGQRYRYDGCGRLVHISCDAGDDSIYTYDGNGNRLTASASSGVTYYEYDQRDRLRQFKRPDGTCVIFEYDRDGNRISRRCGQRLTSYHYDAQGRLTQLVENGVTLARYRYDALGRRVSKHVDGVTTIFHYDQQGQLLAETDELGQVHATYVWIGSQCIARIDGAVGQPVTFYHHDHLGSGRAETDGRGATIWQFANDAGPFGETVGPFFARKPRDEVTGFYDFGTRFYDPETGRFLTADTWTYGPDDWRLLFDPPRDFWGQRKGGDPSHVSWMTHPQSINRYAFCLNDPINNIDLDGHSAWWFLLTIPSSLTWALPNTIFALILAVLNFIMELVGWVVYVFVSLFRRDFSLTSYPWGFLRQTGTNPPNPFDTDERAHFWLGLDGSTRLGVPWTLLNGSFFVWAPFTLGNAVFIEDIKDNGEAGDKNSRFVVPKDPDVQLSRLDSLRHHEMQHVFQYAMLGPLFHCMPIPLLVRLIDSQQLDPEDVWWEKLDLGGLAWLVGGLVFLLTGGKIDPADVQRWVNPATWWQLLGTSEPTEPGGARVPAQWVRIVSAAWNLENWTPGVGVYEWDLLFSRRLERNAGANSGTVTAILGTTVEAEKKKVYVGQFTRVIGVAPVVPPVPPLGPPPFFTATTVDFTIDPPVTNVGPAAASLNPNALPHEINFNSVHPAGGTVTVVNGEGFYFHSLDTGTFKITATGSLGTTPRTPEDVEIKVVDINVKFKSDVFICQRQTIEIRGDGNATYSLRIATNNSGASLAGMQYTAGDTAGADTLEVVARYSATAGAFAKYGDNGLAAHDYVVKQIQITVKEPTITPSAVEAFVGGQVTFTIDHAPTSANSTQNVAGSRFDLASRTFTAGRGPIAADTVETITFEYGCRRLTTDIRVKPITANSVPPEVAPGGTAQINVVGGQPPYRFEVSVASSTGPQVDANGQYTAGNTTTPVTDTITITDQNGQGGRARAEVRVRP